MIALSTWDVRILLIVTLVAALVISAFRIARIARRLGRSPKAWFFISLFFTAIPATIVFWHDRAKVVTAGYAQPEDEDADATAPPPRPTGQCPHCGAILDAADQAVSQCPHCHMKLDEGHCA